MIRPVSAVFAMLVSAVAIAQQPAPAAAPTAALTAASKPPHNCAKPELPSKFMSDNQRKGYNRSIEAYKDCIQKFATDQNSNAKALIDAGNAAISEFNEFIAEVKKASEAADR